MPSVLNQTNTDFNNDTDNDAILNDSLTEDRAKGGEWNFIGYNMYECSKCKIPYTTEQLESWQTYTYDSDFPPFCPRCGAKMVDEVTEHYKKLGEYYNGKDV